MLRSWQISGSTNESGIFSAKSRRIELKFVNSLKEFCPLCSATQKTRLDHGVSNFSACFSQLEKFPSSSRPTMTLHSLIGTAIENNSFLRKRPKHEPLISDHSETTCSIVVKFGFFRVEEFITQFCVRNDKELFPADENRSPLLFATFTSLRKDDAKKREAYERLCSTARQSHRCIGAACIAIRNCIKAHCTKVRARLWSSVVSSGFVKWCGEICHDFHLMTSTVPALKFNKISSTKTFDCEWITCSNIAIDFGYKHSHSSYIGVLCGPWEECV